jgi:hypothetical protein
VSHAGLVMAVAQRAGLAGGCGVNAHLKVGTRARSGTTSWAPGAPTPRSPKSRTRCSPSKKGQAVTARLIVHPVRDLNKQSAAGQDELFPTWRYHAVFTDSPFELIQAEGQHRGHAALRGC